MNRLAFSLLVVRTLPRARRWVRQTIETNRAGAHPLSERALGRLPECFAMSVLQSVTVVEVDHVPQPPLRDWGIHEARSSIHAARVFVASAITLDQTIFIHRDRAGDESLLFHELVHVVQWRTLGWNRFLLMYGLGLVEHGYAASPLEVMAYDLQHRFDQHDWARLTDADVARRTREAFADFTRQSLLHRMMGMAINLAPAGPVASEGGK